MELGDFKGIGPQKLQHLRAAGIYSLRDLFFTLPVRYEDHMKVSPCSECHAERMMVHGKIAGPITFQRYRGISRIRAFIRDESGTLSIQWFNAPWIRQHLTVGRELYLYGRVSSGNGSRFLSNPQIVTEFGWIPVYRQIAGFPQKSHRKLLHDALTFLDEACPETLPDAFRTQYNLISLHDALVNMHFPASSEAVRQAHRRLNFERILMYLICVSASKHHKKPAPALCFPADASEKYWEGLPFSPTAAQKKVLNEIAEDLKRNVAMSRLVQGDVGSGKTAVAFGAICLTALSGFQSAMMAPTEILASQHYQSARDLLEKSGLSCALLTGSTSAGERRKILREIENGEIDTVFGTHALLGDSVLWNRLGLVITDEQHRFGVNQRTCLQNKGLKDSLYPHLLVMSATPIPRSMALILFGDLDLSVIDEMPAGRLPVKTYLVPEMKRSDMYGFLRDEIRKGRQGYVVCPLVDPSEEDEPNASRSAKSVWEELTSSILSDVRIGITWGRQSPSVKEQTLKAFREGEIDVLVSTTVIEVGINNPNATVMIIEDAHRFGLSQLHQLRGRVGRGNQQSWCFLRSEHGEKLRILCETNDGFLVSQTDLEQRGPGDLIGTRQSGKGIDADDMAGGDIRLLDEVSQCVRRLYGTPSSASVLSLLEEEAAKYVHFHEIGIS